LQQRRFAVVVAVQLIGRNDDRGGHLVVRLPIQRSSLCGVDHFHMQALADGAGGASDG
jgi:hypothetical protein